VRPRLIVNGDDLGRTESLTHGVFEAHSRGILSSTSLVAGSGHFDLAVSLAKQHPTLGVGVHLVLDEYEPVSEPRDIPGMLDSAGQYHARSTALRRLLLGQIPTSEIAREWEAQIARVVDAGIRPTHLDGHGHCHASPNLAGVVLELAARFGIGSVRLPAERFSWRGASGGFAVPRHVAKCLLNASCVRPRSRWKGRILYPDAFFGFMEAGQLSVVELESVARSLDPRVSELMAHPALDNEDPPYGLAYDWRGDFETLVAYTREEFEDRFGVRLVSFRDAWAHD
jgi:predicted glycoside hydrolase/deacetylase ChbG (UPF0249 family)